MKNIILVILVVFLLSGCGEKSVFKNEITQIDNVVPTIKMEGISNQKYGWGLKKNKNAPPEIPSATIEMLKNYGGIYRSDEEKTLYLTFDEGYENGYTAKILDVLKENKVPAAFFVTGPYIKKEQELIKRMTDEGHIVGNHTVNHDYDYIYSAPEALLEEINRTKDAITNAGGGSAYAGVIRFPGGAFRDERAEYKQMLIENDIPYANWNCMTGDSETKTPIASDLISRAKRSAQNVKGTSLVMLMHDAGAKQASVDALPSIIEYFKDEGYRFDVIKRK